MLRIELHIGSNVYRFASEPLDYQGYFWEGRINNTFEIQRLFTFTDKTGNRKRSLSITMDNNDSFFTSLHDSVGLLNRKLIVYYEDGANLTKKMVAHTTEILNLSRTININISEYDNLYFDQPIPDAQIAYDYYSENGFNENWNAIPIIFGNVNRLRVAWIDKVNFRFMISSGENFRINKVYFDKQPIYEHGVLNGYKATPESNNIKVRVYRGSQNEVVDGIPSAHPNFSYIEFYDEATGDPIEPLMTDGKVPEIYVDVSGVVNDSKTAAERNPCRILHKLMTYPQTGYNGWGMGVPATDVNFNEAIGWCDSNGIFVDGVIDKRLNASEWCDEFCRHSNTSLIEDNGILTLVIDKKVNSVSCEFDEAGELGYHCNIENCKEPALEAQINRVRLFYKYNYEFDNFDKRPDINEESPCKSAELRDEDHRLRIGQWNTATQEFNWFTEDEPAHKIAQLYFKREILQLKTVTFFTSTEIPSALDVRNKINLTSSRYNWTQKPFIIQEITKGEKGTRVTCREYDETAYDSVLDLTPVEYVKAEYGKYDIPLKPTNLTAVASVSPKNDGTLQTTLSLSATKLSSNIKLILFYRKKTTDSNWQFFASTETESLNYIWDREDGDYYIRAVSQTPYGVCSDLEIQSGDTHYKGQPGAESALTINTNYTTVQTPAKPVVGVYVKSVRIQCAQGVTKSKDIVAFEVYRAVSPYSSWTKVGEVAVGSFGELAILIDSSTDYGITYKYKTRSVNSTGNYSDYSPDSDEVTTTKILNVDLAPLSVDLANICNNAIRDCHIYAGAVTALKIGASAILACHVGANEIIANTANIKDAVISSAKIASLTADKICTGTLGVGGSITVCGVVYASAGSFTGAVCATSGCFTGTVNANAGCFCAGIVAASGTIGGWTIGATSLSACCSVWNSGSYPHMYFYCGGGGQDFLTVGRCLWGGYCCGNYIAWETSTGISYVDNNTCLVFQLSSGRKYIAGWNFTTDSLTRPISSGAMTLAASASSMYIHRDGVADYGEWFGQIYNRGWTGRYGIAVTRGCGAYVFRSDTDVNGANACNMIAGWQFNNEYLYQTTVDYYSAMLSGVNGVQAVCFRGCSGGNFVSAVLGTTTLMCSGLFLYHSGTGYNINMVNRTTGNNMLDAYGCYCIIKALATNSWGIIGCAPIYGVHGYSCNCYGVYGLSSCIYGVIGCAAGYATVGISSGCYGMYAYAACHYGIQACASGQYGGYFSSGSWPSLYATFGLRVDSNLDIYAGYLYVHNCPVYATAFCTWSSRELKKDFTEVGNIMPYLKTLPLMAYKYKTDKEQKWQFGPMAEDFKMSFPWLGDGVTVPTLDRLAIKGIQELDEQVIKLSSTISDIDNRLKNIENILSQT